MLDNNFKKNSTFYAGLGHRNNNIAKKMKSYSDSPNTTKRKQKSSNHPY